MALSNAVEGATHTAQQITWVDGDGDPLNLTGATITARIKDLDTGEARAATGTQWKLSRRGRSIQLGLQYGRRGDGGGVSRPVRRHVRRGQ
jgi:hypothetical protein